MPEQKSIRTVVLIAAIILGALILLAVRRHRRANESYSKYLNQDHSEFELADENNSKAGRPKASLNDIIKNARTWSASYQSWYGKAAPDFILTDITGKDHRLSDYRGRSVMLIFWATWCQPCRMEIPHLIALRNSISKDKLAMLAISNEQPKRVRTFVADQKINYTVLLNPQDMPKPYSYVNAIPSSFFIDPDGRIKLATMGLLSSPEIRAILQAK